MLEIQSCSRCDSPAVIHQPYSGQHLCQVHLAQSIRKRTSKALRAQLELPSDARDEKGNAAVILVCISGGKDSAVLLDMMVNIVGDRRDVELVCGCVDEGIEGYRAPSLECARQLAQRHQVRFETVSYPELGFERMDEVVNRLPLIHLNHPQTKGMAPCSFCGVFRRQGLNHLAERVGAQVLALGHNLDDMAQTVLMNMQKGDVERTLRLAPHTTDPIEGIPPRIVPLRWIPEQEVHACAMALDLPFFHDECPHAAGALRQRNRQMVALLEQDVPGSRHGLVHMVDAIKELERTVPHESRPQPPKPCPLCGSPASGEICKACEFRAMLDETA